MVNSTKPSATKANSTARTVSILSSRAKAASTEIGAGSGSLITWLRTVVFSHCPRIGSGMRNAATASTATGRPSRKNAQRQPSSPPATNVTVPTAIGLMAATARPVDWVSPPMRPRTPIG